MVSQLKQTSKSRETKPKIIEMTAEILTSPEVNAIPFEERMVFVVPSPGYLDIEREMAERAGQEFERDCVLVAINPAAGEFKDRFGEILSRDLEVEAEPITMPLTCIDEDGQNLTTKPHKTNEEYQILHAMMDNDLPGNIGGWYGYKISGESLKLRNPLFVEAVAALVAREVGRPEEPLYLEDVTRDEPKVMSIASKDSNLADQITDEYRFLSLDEIITEEMKCVEKGKEPSKARITARALGHKVVQTLSIQIPQRPVYH